MEFEFTSSPFPGWQAEYRQACIEHANAIAEQHPAFIELIEEPAFAYFVELREAQAIVYGGTASEIIDLIDQYIWFKRVMNAPQCTATERVPLIGNARELRALRRLLQGAVLREEMDRVVGASNSPEYVRRLRNKLAIAIKCEMVERVDRDGKPCFVGRYSITERDKLNVRRVLALADLHAALQGVAA